MILTDHAQFKDEFGRALLLRGVNLSGSSKVPCTPDGATYRREGFFNHREVSFVGRPFPLDEADEHFARLKAWGFTFLRLLVTWEAIEHEGPGLYDEAYLDYLRQVAIKAGEHELSLFIDPHQDAWSRFTGGDGAPGWTLEAAGLDMMNFDITGAAITHQMHGDPLPRMIWPTNYTKLACATMFTLFFAGNDFAPNLKVDGEPIQEYLQHHYCAAMQQVALRLKDLPNVAGYEAMNEPLAGYVGCPDLAAHFGRLRLGDCPTPFQSMLLGAGIPQQVETWKLGRLSLKRTGRRWLNEQRESAWLQNREGPPPGAGCPPPGAGCIWRQHGVWDLDRQGKPALLQPGYFARAGGRMVDFNRDYLMPFTRRYAQAIRQVAPQALIFFESDPTNALPPEWREEGMEDGFVFAPHWYDALTLLTKRYTSLAAVDELTGKAVFGAGRIRKSFAAQMKQRKDAAAENFGGIACLIGETGIPFDLDGKKAFQSGDFSQHVQALERVFRALEDNLLSCTLWNYTPDNSNARGDLWNDEDFSIFSRDQQLRPEDLNSGGRALEALVRPYPARIAGELLELSFDYKTRALRFTFRHDPQVSAPSEVFVPNLQYPSGIRVEVSDGRWKHHPDCQLLIYAHTAERPVHTLVIAPAAG